MALHPEKILWPARIFCSAHEEKRLARKVFSVTSGGQMVGGRVLIVAARARKAGGQTLGLGDEAWAVKHGLISLMGSPY